MATGPGVNRSVVPNSRRWTRIVYVALPLLAVFNYLVIFQWTFFESISTQLFPSESFHPAPFQASPHGYESHGKEGPDYWTWETPTKFKPLDGVGHEGSEVDLCDTFPAYLLNKIQVILKVGAADDPKRTESQLASVIRCIRNVLIISDKNHTYGESHRAMDILATLPAETYLAEEDLAVYELQKNTTQENLRQGHNGWKIDKYKFLPEVEYAVVNVPDAEWYVFLESDTYLFWDNLFRLLENYDYTLPYYFGSPSPGRKLPDSEGKIWFAYGGCGFILSNAAAHRFVDRKRNRLGVKGPRVTDEYKEDILSDCCGDSILGWALHDKGGVDISGLWPMFNPHSLSGVPFGKHYWCEPVISLHKSAPDEMKKLWEWEMQRDKTKRPLLYADLIQYHDLGTFTHRLDWDAADWDGFQESDTHPAHTNMTACEQACRDNEQCYQWTWHGHHCYFASSIRMGHHKDPDGEHEAADRRYMSGWDVEKIQKWIEEHPCKEGPHWVKPSIKRKF